ncbi:hypothetical protein BHE74_00043843 [Ensete ventricosum]|nr:hypothetical protein BHE74_00043843 [Ensete ventricosum]
MLRLSVTQEWVDKGELSRERTNQKWRRPYDVLAEAPHGEVVVRWESATQKSKVLVRKEMDSEECHSAAEADLPMARKGHRCEATDSRVIGLAAPWYHIGGTSVEASTPCSHGGRVLVAKGVEEVENAKEKLQVPRHGRKAEAKELHKTGVNKLLIKIAENEGLRVDAGVLDQGTK